MWCYYCRVKCSVLRWRVVDNVVEKRVVCGKCLERWISNVCR
jgi:hypothetical protein